MRCQGANALARDSSDLSGLAAIPKTPSSLLPVSLQMARIITTAAVAAFFEEAGFRGFCMRALQACCGPRSAIAISTLAFYALHLGHDWARGDLVSMLAIAVPFFITGTWLSGSLLPSMLLHFSIDATLLPLEWCGLHQLTPVVASGDVAAACAQANETNARPHCLAQHKPCMRPHERPPQFERKASLSSNSSHKAHCRLFNELRVYLASLATPTTCRLTGGLGSVRACHCRHGSSDGLHAAA
jgi:CAAX prenyl protease-like protein